uniref:PD-(D/E)XK endonuclease-like domain-containing protein n=1 Tax=viral metagenome TaxID=1070528 RepID=A0A6C0KS80_9ZZZZ
MSNTVLYTRNSVDRDAQIKFYARGHKYEILSDKGSKYTSVTTWNHSQFPKFDADAVINNIFKSKSWGPGHKYWGQTAEQIKLSWKSNGEQVAGAGTNLHERIEYFMNNDNLKNDYTFKELYENYLLNNKIEKDECKEWNYFLQFVKDNPDLMPYRTEWMIFHEELKLAGSIDMIFKNKDGSLSIYDWKRSKEITKINNWNQFALNPLICHMPDSNFWHYSLQLNTYKKILEEKYDKKIKDLYLVRLHPDIIEETYELLEVPSLEKEMNELFEERRKEISF